MLTMKTAVGLGVYVSLYLLSRRKICKIYMGAATSTSTELPLLVRGALVVEEPTFRVVL